MAGSFVVDGDNVIVTFTYAGPTTKVQQVITDGAHALYDRNAPMVQFLKDEDGNLPAWESLTNNQKLAVCDKYVRHGLIGISQDYYVNDAAETAKEVAIADFDDGHELGE